MHFDPTYLSYESTGLFSNLAVDYIAGDEKLKKYFSYKTDNEGIINSVENRKSASVNRKLLVEQLELDYADLPCSDLVSANIRSLQNENTFTVCTAHQPNIFTGHLYFIYKIIHAIRLADELNEKYPDWHFVPVYFMGSEDADLDELGQIVVDGISYKWQTNQKGAVGRMRVDEGLIKMIDGLENQLAGYEFGSSIMAQIRSFYTLDKKIDKSTFEFVNQLFGKYGLIILIPDNSQFKQACKPVFRKEIEEQFSSKILTQTLKDFPSDYNIQTRGREVNLFYLQDGSRERIEKTEDGFAVANTGIRFSKEELLTELDKFPERFSPNVILRPLVQELLLPNVAFIGGGGELAYWLELKKIFESVAIHYPMLVLRNSFMFVAQETMSLINQLNLSTEDFFLPTHLVSEKYVKSVSSHRLTLGTEKQKLQDLYDEMARKVGASDITLAEHTQALKAKALKKIEELEKKQLQAEKRNNAAAIHKIEKIKNKLFPGGILQERTENVMSLYALYGDAILRIIYSHSKSLEQCFCILEFNTIQ